MTDTTDREIVVNRVIDAPRELVFDAFTQKSHIEGWWAPPGSTSHEMDVKPGGVWRYSQTVRGAEQAFKVEFIEIDKPTRLVWDYGMDADQAPEPARTIATFEDQEGKTKVTLQLIFATVAAREEAAKYGAQKGAQMALDALADYLAQL